MKTTLPSGAVLDITVASFQDAMELQKAILRSVKGIPLEESILSSDLTAYKDAVLSTATSDDVERALFKCFQRVLYDGARVTAELFDDPKLGMAARKDYYLMAWEVIKENCGPFFVETFSKLKTSLAMKAGTPKPS